MLHSRFSAAPLVRCVVLRLRVAAPPRSAFLVPVRAFRTPSVPLLSSFHFSQPRLGNNTIDSTKPPPPKETNGNAGDSPHGTQKSETGAHANGPVASSGGEYAGTSADAEESARGTVATQKSGKEERSDDGFDDDAIVVKDEKGNYITRIRRLPLTLIEEVPLPQRILTDLELVMMAWCEEHARQYAIFMTAIRISIFVLLFIILYVFYKTTLSSERVLRGVDKMPADLRIGSVVYFDITENGTDIGRIVIGLLNEDCPLYCEYFHRYCTGSGGRGDSFRGMPLAAIVPRHCLIFGDGHDMVHGVPGFDPHYLPTEHLSNGAWRGALSAIAYSPNRESPNFLIHVSAGDYTPQVFAVVIGGYNVIERMNNAGSKHGNAPKKHYVIEGCGELCTLAKSHITPMPWKLYESISVGYDEEKFGPRMPEDVLLHSDQLGAKAREELHKTEVTAEVKRKRWWWPL